MMKKANRSYDKTYPMLRLFKDDIKQIVDLVEKNHKDAEIILDEYKIEDSSEVDKLPKKPASKFYVQFFQRYREETPYRSELLTLDLTSYGASLRVSNEDDTYLRGIASQIDSLFSRRESKLNKLVGGPVAVIISLIILLPISIILIIPWSYSIQPLLAILLTLIML